MNRVRARTLARVSLACLALALMVRLWPVGVPSAPAGMPGEAAPPTAPRVPEASDTPVDYSAVVEGNILSRTRQPPPLEPEAEPTAPALQGPARPTLPRYRLSGLVRSAEGIVALIDADPAVPGAELYQVGDRVGPYILEQASDSSVVLRGPNGLVVLRLESAGGMNP